MISAPPVTFRSNAKSDEACAPTVSGGIPFDKLVDQLSNFSAKPFCRVDDPRNCINDSIG